MEEIKVENLNSVSKKISIYVPQEKVGKKFDDFYNELKNKVVLKGFRKGSVPRNILEYQFGIQAKSTISQSLFSEYYKNALKEHSISPICDPSITNIDLEKNIIGSFDDKGFSVDVYVEVMPNIEMSGYENMELDFPQSNIQKIMDSKINEARERFAERRQVQDRGAQQGDMVILDFVGRIEGTNKVIKEDGFTIKKLCSGANIAGFDEQVVGTKINEQKQFSLVFPDNAGELANKKVDFSITIQNVIEIKPAVVDNDLALMVGYNSVEEMMTLFEKEAKDTEERINKENLELQIIKKLSEVNKVEIPESMVQNEKNRILEDVKTRGLKIDKNIEQNIEGTARYNIVRHIITGAIYEKHPELQIDPVELDTELEKHSKINNCEKSVFTSNLYNNGLMDQFLGMIKTRKVINMIIEKAKSSANVNE